MINLDTSTTPRTSGWACLERTDPCRFGISDDRSPRR